LSTKKSNRQLGARQIRVQIQTPEVAAGVDVIGAGVGDTGAPEMRTSSTDRNEPVCDRQHRSPYPG
jgi:hypothetical protein